MSKDSDKTLILLFSIEPEILVDFFSNPKFRKNKPIGLTTSYNNLYHPLKTDHYSILDPIELLGQHATGTSFKHTYDWQENIAAHMLADGITLQSKTKRNETSVPGYLSWVMRFTPFYHTRQLVIDTIDAAIRTYAPQRIIFFGKARSVPWHRDLAIKTIDVLSPDATVYEFEDIVEGHIRSKYLDYIAKIENQIQLDAQKVADEAAVKAQVIKDKQLKRLEDRKKARAEAIERARIRAEERARERQRLRVLAIEDTKHISEIKRLDRELAQEEVDEQTHLKKLEERGKLIKAARQKALAKAEERAQERQRIRAQAVEDAKREAETKRQERKLAQEEANEKKRLKKLEEREKLSAEARQKALAKAEERAQERQRIRAQAVEDAKREAETKRQERKLAQEEANEKKRLKKLEEREKLSAEARQKALAKAEERAQERQRLRAQAIADTKRLAETKRQERKLAREEANEQKRLKQLEDNDQRILEKHAKREEKQFHARLSYLKKFSASDFAKTENFGAFKKPRLDQRIRYRLANREDLEGSFHEPFNEGKFEAFKRLKDAYSKLRKIAPQQAQADDDTKALILECETLLDKWFPLRANTFSLPKRRILNKREVTVRLGFIGARINYENSRRNQHKLPQSILENPSKDIPSIAEYTELELKTARVILQKAYNSVQILCNSH